MTQDSQAPPDYHVYCYIYIDMKYMQHAHTSAYIHIYIVIVEVIIGTSFMVGALPRLAKPFAALDHPWKDLSNRTCGGDMLVKTGFEVGRCG
jgi:hypothetical protein